MHNTGVVLKELLTQEALIDFLLVKDFTAEDKTAAAAILHCQSAARCRQFTCMRLELS